MQWVVVLEVAVKHEESARSAALKRLVDSLLDVEAIALSGRNRYALQARVSAATCPEALMKAFSRWQEVVASADLPSSQVVRADVVTVDEFERERRARGNGGHRSRDGEE